MLTDEPCLDLLDLYQADRAAPAAGTFWQRLIARNPNAIGRFARARKGYVTAPWDWTTFQTELYVVDAIQGPDANGKITVVLSDGIKLLDRSKVPAVTDGQLQADVLGVSNGGTLAAASSATVTLPSAASALDGSYVGQEIFILANTGAGQRRVISAYAGVPRIATVSAAWTVIPDASSSYEITPLSLMLTAGKGAKYTNPVVSGKNEYVRIDQEIIQYTQKGYALSFDGVDDYVNVPSSSTLNVGANEFTVEFWANIAVFGPDVGFLGRRLASNTWWRVVNRTIGLRFEVANTYPTNYFISSPVGLSQLGKAAHFVFIRRIAAGIAWIDQYVNGILMTSESTGTAAFNVDDAVPFEIGHWSTGYSNAVIDGIRLYSRALSAAEVIAHYQDIFSNNAGLIASWNFEEGSGTITADGSGNGNTGTLIDTPAWVSGMTTGDRLSWPDGTYRAQFGTARADHKSGGIAQLCRAWIGKLASDVVHDIMNAGGLVDAYIDLAGLATEDTDWLGESARITTCVPDPETASALLADLCQDLEMMCWWDPVAQQAKFKVDMPQLSSSVGAITDDKLMLGQTLVERKDTERITEAAIDFGLASVTANRAQRQSFRNIVIYVDADAESANGYGDVRPHLRESRWLNAANFNLAASTVARKLSRLRDAPSEIACRLDPKDEATLGALVDLTTRKLVDNAGNAKTVRCRVMKRTDQGAYFDALLRTTVFARRYGFICSNGFPDYPGASSDQRLRAFIGQAGTGLMSDGTSAYLIS